MAHWSIQPRRDNDDESLARLATDAPRIPWDVFKKDVFRWEKGEHLAAVGPTGQGKTTLLHALLPSHKYTVVLATKPKDKSMDRLAMDDYVIFKQWRSVPAAEVPRRILWPNSRVLDSRAIQKDVLSHALQKIYLEGGWTVAIDELWYIINILGMEEYVKLYLLQARALGISLVGATQRPVSIPLEVYDQSTHLFFFRDNDEANLKRLSGISYRSAGMIRQIISNLDRFQVLYVNTRTGQMVRTRAPFGK